MRTIDADAFDKRMRTVVGVVEGELSDNFKNGVLTTLKMLQSQPTIKPERPTEPQIIHCKDCMYKEVHGTELWCDQITGTPIMVKESDFCSWAEMEAKHD